MSKSSERESESEKAFRGRDMLSRSSCPGLWMERYGRSTASWFLSLDLYLALDLSLIFSTSDIFDFFLDFSSIYIDIIYLPLSLSHPHFAVQARRYHFNHPIYRPSSASIRLAIMVLLFLSVSLSFSVSLSLFLSLFLSHSSFLSLTQVSSVVKPTRKLVYFIHDLSFGGAWKERERDECRVNARSQNQTDVISLIGENPFSESAPLYVKVRCEFLSLSLFLSRPLTLLIFSFSLPVLILSLAHRLTSTLTTSPNL